MSTPAEKTEPAGLPVNEIAEGVTDFILEIDGDFRVVYINAATERLGGMPRAEVLGRSCWDVFGSAIAPLEDAIRRCAAEKASLSLDQLHEATQRWYEVNLTPRRAGGVIFWARDITARKTAAEQARAKEAADEQLRLSEERFRVALRASGFFVWQQDINLRYTWQYNTGAPFSGSEWLGKTNAELFGPDDAAQLMEIERRTIESGTGSRGEISLTPAGERRYYLYNVEPLRDASGSIVGLTGAAVDITEQKAREHGLLDRKKLESIGLLAGGIAHDFNNLLVGIIGNASLATNLLPEDNPVHGLLSGILSSGERAADLTRQILAFSGQGRFIIEPVHLSTLVEQMRGLLQSCLRERTRLALDLAPDAARVEADAIQMQQLVMNLVLNAAEAIGRAPGVILVRTRNAAITAAELRKCSGSAELPPGHCVCLEVRDTGPGMDDQTRSRIFEPFFTTKSVGRGLGLPAALGIVLGHRGAISVTSKPGHGTTIRVMLPPASA